MGAVHVGIGHDDDFAVAQLGEVKVLPNAGAQGHHHGHQLFVGVDLVQPCLLHVEHLAPQGQDGLELPVPPALGGASGGVALHDVDFGLLHVAALAVGQLAGQGGALQGVLAAGQVPGFPGGFPRAGGGQRLVKNGAGGGGVLLQVGHHILVHQRADQGADLRVAQLSLGLALELGLLQLHADDAGQALPHVLAGELLVVLLEDVVLAGVIVHHPG